MSAPTDPAKATQAALIKRLQAVHETYGRVWDMPPAEQDRARLYVVVGEGELVPVDEECFDRTDAQYVIRIWSNQPGYTECKLVGGAIRMALHEQDLTIQGHVVDEMRVISVGYRRDRDGLSSVGTVLVRIETQPA